MPASIEIPGITAHLDKLIYHHDAPGLAADQPHVFVYFITIRNASLHTVTLLGRKWIIRYSDHTQDIIEGDKIVGETPRLAPGEQFSYNSYLTTHIDAEVRGTFHGIDENGRKIHVALPPFALHIPSEDAAPDAAP